MMSASAGFEPVTSSIALLNMQAIYSFWNECLKKLELRQYQNDLTK